MKKIMKKLFRSNKNRVFGGVCGGIGEFTEIDPVIIRLLCVCFFFVFGTGLIMYLLSWLIIPNEIIEDVKPEESFEEKTK